MQSAKSIEQNKNNPFSLDRKELRMRTNKQACKVIYVFFRLGNICKPIVKIIDNSRQIILALIPFNNVHVTLHPQKNGDILQNFFDDKYTCSYAEQVVNTAKILGYKNSSKHKHYLFQREYSIYKDMPLFAHKIDLNKISVPIKKIYFKNYIEVDAVENSFYLTVYFSKEEGIKEKEYLIKIPISLGNFFLKTCKI